jgi:orotate phosphoribosyltransferase
MDADVQRTVNEVEYLKRLRDEFAISATASIMTAYINNPEKDGLTLGAELAYRLADKMLIERKK